MNTRHIRYKGSSGYRYTKNKMKINAAKNNGYKNTNDTVDAKNKKRYSEYRETKQEMQRIQ